MAVTLGDLRQHAFRILSEDPPKHIDVTGIINAAGRHMVGMASWRWRNLPAVPLDYQAPISFTAATYTHASKNIAKTGAFANYTFVEGDVIDITVATGADDLGKYQIASKTDDDNIVLVNSLGSGADAQADIAGQIDLPYLDLPSNVGDDFEIVSLTHDNSIAHTVVKSNLSHIRWMRRVTFDSQNLVYWDVVNPRQVAQTSAKPNSRIEIYPTPTALDVGVLTASIKGGWVTLDDEDEVANTPTLFDAFLGRCVRAFAHEALTDDESRIGALKNSEQYLTLMRMDSAKAWDHGVSEGGVAQKTPAASAQWNFTTVNPS